MSTNVHFSKGTPNEQFLYEDLVIEAIGIYGHDVFYIPRTLVDKDQLYGEDSLSKKSGKVVKKAGGGMTRVGLSPAEMARAGTMSEAKRRRYAKKGGTVNRKGGGQIGVGSAYVQAQYDN